MSDLISRQAAKLAIVEKGQASKRYKIGEFWELNRDEIWDALDGVPSAQPEIRYYGQFEIKDPILISEWHWIPVSEKMPEGGHNIIFCDSKGNVCEGVYHAILGQWVGFRWNAIYHHDDVVAWMPLPDPYKEEERCGKDH